MHPSLVRVLVAALLCLPFLTGMPAAAAPDEVHLVLTIDTDGRARLEGPQERARLTSEEPHERYAWALTLDEPTYIEVRILAGAFDVERPMQVVPHLDDPANAFPLFHPFARAEVWQTDGPARVYHHHMDGTTSVYRLQVPGPKSATLQLEKDTAPPVYTLGEIERVTRSMFYQETWTDEFAIGDLRVRPQGSDAEWVENPTPSFDVWQKFPVQGLDAGVTYEIAAHFTDWAGNVAVAPLYNVTTQPPADGPTPAFEVLSPLPDARLATGSGVTVEVRIHSTDPIDPDSVRLFLDLAEQRDGVAFDGVTVQFAVPGTLSEGRHVLWIEAATAEGVADHLRWTFQVGSTVGAAGLSPFVLLLALLGGLALSRYRAGRSG